MNKYQKQLAATQFVTWMNSQRDQDPINPEAIEAWAASFIECDIMFCYGRGHQSKARCEGTDKGHTYHSYEDMEFDEAKPDNYDERLSDQTYSPLSSTKVYRLVFSDRGWY